MERTGSPRGGMFALLLFSTRSRGFTLVELVTTMVIVGVLAAVIAPRFIGRQGFEARGYYDASATAIRYAQKTAIAKRRSTFVVLTATQTAICYDAACTSRVTDPATGGALIVDAKRGVASLAAPVSVTPVTFSFDGLGQPTFAGPPGALVLTYTPAEAGDVTRTLYVEPGTGYVHFP
jgi:MSHA pilin protein MshC